MVHRSGLAALRDAVLPAAAFAFLSLALILGVEPRGDVRALEPFARYPWVFWLLFVAFVGLLLLRPRFVDRSPRVELVLTGATVFAAVAPFASKVGAHLACPTLGLVLGYLLWPLLAQLTRRVSQHQVRLWLLRYAPLLLFLGVFLLAFVQSYRRHYWFGSAGKDLGLFHQSIWLLSRFEAPENTIMGMNAFADHMEFIDVLVAPLMWIWPDAGALLLFQAACVASGAVALFDLARRRLDSDLLGVLLALTYLFAIDMQNAIMFDWNPTTCGAGLLPWVVWSFEQNRKRTFVLSLLLVAACKENLILYALAVCLVLGLESRARKPFAAAAVLAALFMFEMKVLFPLFREEGFRHLRYEDLGGSASEIITSVISNPARAFALLMAPTSKLDGLLAPFSSVAFAIVLAPRWILALLPMLLERLWSTHTNRYFGYHYGAALAPIAVIGSIRGLEFLGTWVPEPRRRYVLGVAAVTLITSAVLVSARARGGPPPLLGTPHYYTTPEDRVDSHEVLALIPSDASVAAQNHLLPHLSARHELFEIRKPITADYVAINFRQGPWPFDKKYIQTLAKELPGLGYGVLGCQGDAVVFKRGAPSISCPVLERANPL